MTRPAIRFIQGADLDACQRVLLALSQSGDPAVALSRVLLVPSRHAGEQLRRTFERHVLIEEWRTPFSLARLLDLPAALPAALPADRPSAAGTALVPPSLLTREAWYGRLHASIPGAGPLLSGITREVLMAAAARGAAATGTRTPFLMRPGLVAEMVRFNDALCRLNHDVQAAAARLLPELETEAASDHGAARLLDQTRYLLAVFAAYRRRVAESGGMDEQGVRDACRAGSATTGVTHLVVTTGDHHGSADGLWPADLDVLAHLPALQRVDVVCTRREAATGLLDRLGTRWPEARTIRVDAQRPLAVRLEVPAGGSLWVPCRDREEEVLSAARRIKADPPERLESTAIVYRRALPYLYLTQHVFGTAGIPCETAESLPLAAEPWPAALDVLIDCVLAAYTRATLVALLRSPHFVFRDAEGEELSAVAIGAFDRLLARDRYLGGPERLAHLARAWVEDRTSGDRRDLPDARRVAWTAVRLLADVAPWLAPAPAASHLDRLVLLVGRYARDIGGHDTTASRGRRVRAAVQHVVETLADAYRAHDRTPVPARDVFAMLRRWIEARTFAPSRTTGGVQVIDAAAARFGTYARVRLVGLVEGEWPDTSARNIFYPAFLLARLGWPDERHRASSARAGFADLLELPSVAVGVSVPQLEQDAVVRASGLLDELQVFHPDRHLPVAADEASLPVSTEGALLATPLVAGALAHVPAAASWLGWRLGRQPRAEPGRTSPLRGTRYSVTAVERYLQCPFQYFAASVLRLREEVDEEAGLPSRDAGIFVHDVLQACYAAWQATGRVRIGAEDLPEARVLFGEVAERSLARLPPEDRPFERLRLFGSSVTSGLVEKVLRAEVESFGDVARRQLEVEVDGRFTLPTTDGDRTIAIRGRVDRVDHTTGGGVRVIDYKSGRRPSPEAVQPAVYAVCLAQRHGTDTAPAPIAASGYVSLREHQPWAPTVRDEAAAQAQALTFGDAVAGIEDGRFEVRPASVFRCRYCAYDSVCRKDYVSGD